MLNYFIYYHNSVNDLNMKETMYNLYKNMLMSIFAHILISVFYFLVVPATNNKNTLKIVYI